MSQETDKLYPAMLKARMAFPSIHRTANNPFFKSKYAALPDIMAAIEPHLHDNGLMLQSTVILPMEEGARYTLQTSLIHAESGQRLTARYPLNPVKDDPQGFGAALTYAQRYTLNAMFWIAPDFDDDGNEASGLTQKPAPAKPKPAPGPDPLMLKLVAALDSGIVDPEKVAKVRAAIEAEKAKGHDGLSLAQIQKSLDYLGIQ